MFNLIKINLPKTKEEYETGNGEGVWAIVDEECKKAYDADEYGTQYIGILDNDSILYPHMIHGDDLNNLDSYIEKLNNEIIQNSTNEQHIPDNELPISRLNDDNQMMFLFFPLSVVIADFFLC